MVDRSRNAASKRWSQRRPEAIGFMSTCQGAIKGAGQLLVADRFAQPPPLPSPPPPDVARAQAAP
eukprot:2525039-Pyramimonas_sp.AAC.1